MTDMTPPESTADAPEEEPSPLRIALGFFILPLLLVFVGVGVFLLFGVLAHERTAPADYLPEILGRGINEPWQAAFHLAQQLQYDEDLRGDEAFARQVVDALERSPSDDPRVRRFLAIALGRIGHPVAVEALVARTRDPDVETRVNALWALGKIGAQAGSPAAVERLTDDDDAVRTMAGYVLGVLQDPEARPALRVALNDPVPAVRWNAAVALGRMHDPAARQTLVHMIDRDYLSGVPGVAEADQTATVLAALQALQGLGVTGLESTLIEIRDTDPDLRVREAARNALAGVQGSSNNDQGPLLAQEH